MAVTTSQTKIKLNDGSTSNTTVSSVIKWAKKHLEKSNISGYGTITVTAVLQLLIDDMTLDLEPHIIAEPVATNDKSYVREVFASLTPDQAKKYGDGKKFSALILIQIVMKTIADTKMAVYTTKATEFSSFNATVEAHHDML